MEEEEIFDVIIIGCGASGIGAAMEFEQSQSSIKYLILEARERIAGRAFTDKKTFGENIPVDLGAHYLCHQQEKSFFSKYYNASIEDFIESDCYDPTMMKIFNENGLIISDQLIDQSMNIVEHLFSIVKEHSSDEDDDTSILDVIQPKLEEISDEDTRYLVQLFLSYTELHEGSDLNRLSRKYFQKGEAGFQPSDLSLSKGFGSLVEEIASGYNFPIKLNSIVTHIEMLNENNELVRLSTNETCSYLCKYVLLTVPLGCLKANSIQFSPTLPCWKMEAINHMGLALLDKVYLQFSQIFWENHLRRITILHPKYKFYYCLPEHRMLALYISGSIAQQLEQCSDEQIVNEIFHSLRKIYPQITYPIKWLITRWGRDPFSRGSYSSFHQGNNIQTLKQLSRETHNGRIHWAGEHTNFDGPIGYVHSGFQSGIREAQRILKKLYS